MRGLVFVGLMVATMWVVEAVDAAVNGSLDRQGIIPRATNGLDGIVFSPFLHGDWGHLIGNTVPFVVLGGLIALSGLARVAAVTLLVAGIGGVGVWLTASENSIHIGASGIVFGFITYLIARGVWSRRALHLAVGVAVLLVYGGTLAFGFLPTPGVSWQGHAFGALGGILAAWLLDRRRV